MVVKFADKTPLNGLQSMLEGWEMDPRSPAQLATIFHRDLGY